MSRSLSPRQVAAIGCGMLANECLQRAPRAGSLEDIRQEYEHAVVLLRKQKELQEGTLSFTPLIDPDMKLAHETALRRLKP